MKRYLDVLNKMDLFKDIAEADLMKMLMCLNAKLKHYKKGEFIWLAESDVEYIGVVVAGEVLITQDDINGNRNIIVNVKKGDSFAEAMACSTVQKLPTSVTASVDSSIVLMEYRKIIKMCPAACLFHNKMIENMLVIIANKNVMLTKKLNYVSRRSTREKLLAYLMDEATKFGEKKFVVSFNRQEMADYLCVERSAMSNELGKLAKEGILRFKKNEFEFLR